MKFSLKRVLLPVLVITFAFALSCKKDDADQEKIDSKTKIESHEILVNYLSVTLSVDKSLIQFDNETKEFFVPNTVFKASLKEIQERYNNANEYKLKFESK